MKKKKSKLTKTEKEKIEKAIATIAAEHLQKLLPSPYRNALKHVKSRDIIKALYMIK